MTGLFSLIVFALDIWAIVEIVRSRYDTGKKVLWIILILVLPVIGLILYLLLGRK